MKFHKGAQEPRHLLLHAEALHLHETTRFPLYKISRNMIRRQNSSFTYQVQRALHMTTFVYLQ